MDEPAVLCLDSTNDADDCIEVDGHNKETTTTTTPVEESKISNLLVDFSLHIMVHIVWSTWTVFTMALNKL